MRIGACGGDGDGDGDCDGDGDGDGDDVSFSTLRYHNFKFRPF